MEAPHSVVGVGVMSGTSLDGIDLCCAKFKVTPEKGDYRYEYEILTASTVEYSDSWRRALEKSMTLCGRDLALLNVRFGEFCGREISAFIQAVEQEHGCRVQFVGAHGHTVFHEPEKDMTLQIGDGETLACHLTCPLVCNFRNRDVALGGQGAPFAPFGDMHLFPANDIYVNLGGICNVNIRGAGFDVCACNMLLNYLARTAAPPSQCDRDGALARSGRLLPDILSELNSMEYLSRPPPKSLGKEWFEQKIQPVLDKALRVCTTSDVLHTAVEHIAHQLATTIKTYGPPQQVKILMTGGGVFNKYLMERIRAQLTQQDVLAEISDVQPQVAEYKEAIIFAFLALRTLQGLHNTPHRVTGARSPAVSGSIHQPGQKRTLDLFNEIRNFNTP